MTNTSQPKKKFQAIFAVIAFPILFVILYNVFTTGTEMKVADDVVKQYEITKRSGTKIDVCVHAGLVSAAYLQAKDEDRYRQWKQIEKADCAAAGMPSN
jgi:hypothetical protein